MRVWEEGNEGKTEGNGYTEKLQKATWKKQEECLVIMKVVCCVCGDTLAETGVCVCKLSSFYTVLSHPC